LKLALLIPNSKTFIALSNYAIKKLKKDFTSIIVIAHNTALPFEDFKVRFKKAGFLKAFDEFLYCKFESSLGLWDSAFIKNELIYSPNRELISISSLKSNDLAAVLEKNRSDILVGIGCGYVMVDRIPQRVLPINIHPGILPIYRGLGNPEALIKYDYSNMGLTIHRMSKQIDCGQIYFKRKIPLLKRLTIPESYILCYKTGIRMISYSLRYNRSQYNSAINAGTSINHLWRMPLSRYLASRILILFKMMRCNVLS
jgi:hypothetical protein